MAPDARHVQKSQQAGLACVYERELTVEKAVARQGQENAEQGAVRDVLAGELAELTKIYEPIKGRAGKFK